MLNPPPLTFFVRVLRFVNGKGYFSVILRAEWASHSPTVFKVSLKKLLHLFHGSMGVCMVALCFGVAFIRKGKKINHGDTQKQIGAMSACENTAICSWANSSKKEIKVNIRGTGAYSLSPRLHTATHTQEMSVALGNSDLCQAEMGEHCFRWRLMTEEVIKAIGERKEAGDMGKKANIKGMKGIIKQSWKDVKSWLGNPIWQREKNCPWGE